MKPDILGIGTTPTVPPSESELATPTLAGSGQTGQTEDIARLAYALWQGRGCPVGSSDQDWLEAEQQLSTSLPTAAATTAGN